MELTITNNREIKPYKVAVKQYEAGTTSLVFTREGYMYDQVDLRRYKAYAETSINGAVDMTELTYEIVGGNMVITWVIGEQTLRQAGTISYQIVFKEKPAEGLPLDGSGSGVFRTHQAILQNSASIDADGAIAADYPTILKQHLDLINSLSSSFEGGAVFFMAAGQPIPPEERLAGRLYYQIENNKTLYGHFEDHLGNKLTLTQAQLDEKQDKALGIKGQMVVITDVDGNITENTVIGTEELYGLEGFELGKGTFQTQLNKKTEQSDFEAHIESNNAAIDTINQTLEVIQIASDIIEESMVKHAQNESIHVSATDREKWNNAQQAFPTGTLIQSMCPSVQGWLLCDGSTYNKTDYPELATALGAEGDTFAVPDFRGRTMWGASASQPVGAAIGAGLPSLEGRIEGLRTHANVAASGAFIADGGGYGAANGDGANAAVKFDASNHNPIYGASDTVQPPAIAVNVFIKY